MVAHTLAHLTLLYGLLPKEVLPDATGTLLPPAWSISLEWQFYLVAPFFARFIRSRVFILVIGAVSYAGIRLQAHWLNPHLAFLPAQLPLFVIGIGSYHLYACVAKNPGWRPARLLGPLVLLLSGAVLFSWHAVALTVWGVTLSCILVDGAGGWARALGLVRTVLLHPGMQKLGHLSYPLYLIHWPIIIACLALLLRWKPGLSSGEAVGLMLLFSLPAMLVAAAALHRYVEAPLMKVGKRRSARLPSPEPRPGVDRSRAASPAPE